MRCEAAGLRPLPKRVPELPTARLLLRAMEAGDLHALFAIYGDPEVMRHASDPVFDDPATVEQMLRSVDSLPAQGESIEWAVVERDTAALIGTCGLHGFDADAASAEVGILLARRAWGRGHASEALAAVLGWARQALDLGRLVADIDARNQRSLALFERLGFRHGDGSLHVLTLGVRDSAARRS